MISYRRTTIVLAACFLQLGSPLLFGQEIPSSDEVIRVADYPLVLNEKLGVRTAALGVGRLHQIDATLIEIPPGGKLEPHQHLAEEIIYVVSGRGYTDMWVNSED